MGDSNIWVFSNLLLIYVELWVFDQGLFPRDFSPCWMSEQLLRASDYDR